MPSATILASASPIRQKLLRQAGVEFEVVTARIDEEAIKASLLADGVPARDIADALAEAKARRVSASHPQALVIGADQTLEFEGELFSKPETPAAARNQLARLGGRTHKLYSAAVIFQDARPVWRHVATVTLGMRPLSETFIASYVERNWPGISGSVGSYKIEEEGARLFSAIHGSHFAILGIPLIELLSYLSVRGVLET